MDKEKALKIAKQFADVVKRDFQCKEIFLFGSYAKGNFNDESDIDIAVIFDGFDIAINMQLELMRVRRKIDSRIEPHPFRSADFIITNPVANEIMNYGQKIS